MHLDQGWRAAHAPAYRALNPQALVPTLETDGGVLTQSLAIIEYLDEMHPEPPLLPGDALQRARIRAFALAIACDIHPLNNLRVLQLSEGPMRQEQAAADTWYRHWVDAGFAACEALLPAAPALLLRRPPDAGRLSAWSRRYSTRAASSAICRECP